MVKMSCEYMSAQDFCQARETVVAEISAEYFGVRWFEKYPEQVEAFERIFRYPDAPSPPAPEARAIVIRELEQLRDMLRAEHDQFAKR